MSTEQTPLKRHPGLIPLSKEHHFGLLLVWKIRQGINFKVDPERIGKYVLHFFQHDLEEHFKSEENQVFNKMPEKDPLILQAIAEHEKLYDIIHQLKSGSVSTASLEEFAELLEKHIRFEERHLFPHLQNTLTDETLVSLQKELEMQHATCEIPWEDEFWIKNDSD